MHIRRLLVPVDFSRRDETSYCAALDLARAVGAELFVLHVPAPPSAIRLAVDAHLGRPLPRVADAELLQARDRLDALLAIAPRHDVVVHARVEVGDPAATAVRLAAEERIDLIMLATRARTGLLAGSGVARTLIESAPCPVLVLRADHETGGTARATSALHGTH